MTTPSIPFVSSPTITFVPCCAPGDSYARFIGNPIVGMPNNSTWVYTGTSIIQGEGSGPWTQLVPGQCYTVFYNNITVPITTPVLSLTVSSFNNSSVYFPTGKTCAESLYCQRQCIPECFKLWPCDGSIAPFTTSTDLSGFVGNNIIVSSLDPSYNIDNICVFVENISNNSCANSIDIVVNANSCECPCTCYTIIGEIKSVEWIDCFGIYNSVATPLSPFEICAGAYPLTFPLLPNNPLQIISNGLCLESTIFNDTTCTEETVFNCGPACYLLQECFNPSNFIYSNSTSLLGPATLGQVVTIAGYTECWEVLIPQTCDCPINVTVLTVSECCEACLPNINYKLTTCNDSNVYVYTSDDLSLYVDKVIRREDCPEECWIVSQIDGNIPTDIPIVVIEDYLDCTLCYRKYYRLQDCLQLELDIITYTDLSDYVDKVITLDWCPETCWEVSETIEDDGAGIISDVLNSYTECIDCLTSAPCVCSTIKNYNDTSQTYQYLNCEGILQTVTLQPGQKSDRLCLIRWYAPKDCESFIVKQVYSNGTILYSEYSNDNLGSPVPIPNYLNGKPTFYSTALQDFIYYDGKKWILSIYDGNEDKYIPVATLECGADCNCPIGSWINISSLPNQTSNTTIEYKYTIEYFGNCINGVCPPRKNNQKSVTPGYNTPGCEIWKYEEISCRAAEAMYKQVLQLRYGISNCCPEEDEQYIVQKELIDLAALNDPAYPCSTNSCGCSNDCDCSTTQPVCPVTTVSYNCLNGVCTDPGDGSGIYSTLLDCENICCNNAFITTWETTEAMESIILPYLGNLSYLGTYTGTIDWGDGTTDSNSYANSIHTYTTAGTYTVTICGDVIGWNFSLVPNSRLKIKSVLQWGQLQLGYNGGDYFINCPNLDLSSVSDTLDLTGITILSGLFYGCTSLTSVNNINSWDTSAVTDMGTMFYGCMVFNQALSFNTSAVVNMRDMFGLCQAFNQPLSFDTSSVIDMGAMFSACNSFNQPLSFDTSIVTDMSGMFNSCQVFDSTLTFTSTSAVTDMSGMFYACGLFNQPITFNTISVTNMLFMFGYCYTFNQALTFNTSAVTNMGQMFYACNSFQQNIGSWDISNVTNFAGFMLGKTPLTWPTTYFDNLMCGWSTQTVTPNLIIDFGTANYTNATGGPCYTILDTAPNNWTILSGGGV